MYKDITTHNRGDKERKVRILENVANGVRFVVHKHICYGDKWLLSCSELGVEKMDLKTEDVEEAKEKAIIEMIKLLGIAMQKYGNAIKEINRDFRKER